MVKTLNGDDSLENPQILWVAHYYTKPLDGVKTHTHPYYHMIYLVTGSLRFVINNKTYILTPGQSLLIPKNTDHAYYNDEAETAEYFEIKFSLLKSAFNKQIARREIQITENELAGKLFEQIVKEFGRIDILVNNAGITRDAIFHKMTPAQMHQVMNVNFFGTYHCIYNAIPIMRSRTTVELLIFLLPLPSAIPVRQTTALPKRQLKA